MTERSGRPLTERDVGGRVWIANFVFTRCPDVCPALTMRMREVQRRLADAEAPVQIVSFSVDPAHDTPEVLWRYASGHGAAPGWHFVTGPRDAIATLLKDGFRVSFADDGPPTGPITHSDRFVLVDERLRIRGYYHGSDANDLDRLVEDAARLAAAAA
jgi:protein SCO1